MKVCSVTRLMWFIYKRCVCVGGDERGGCGWGMHVCVRLSGVCLTSAY